jgi:1-acyl-sn-glycerol-3-phosphate acyltransferase
LTTLFLALYSFFNRHLKIFWTGLLVLCLAVVWFASKIKFEEDITRFLPLGEENSLAVKEAFANNKLKDKLVVMVSSPLSGEEGNTAMTSFADSFAVRVQSKPGPGYIDHLTYHIEENSFLDLYDELYSNLPLYLDAADYRHLDSLTADSAIEKSMRKNYKSLLAPSGVVMGRFIEKDPLGFASVILNKLKQLQLDNNYEIDNGYIFSGDHKTLLMFIAPAFDPGDTRKNEKFISGIQETISGLQQESKATATLFGGAVVSLANARQMKQDSILTSSIAMILIILMLYFFFRKKRILLLIILPVVFGAGFSLALLYLIKAKVSIIAVGAGSVILGLAINYSLHFFVHYKHVRNVRQTIRDLASPMTIGSITTIGAFLGLLFIKSELLQDFGMFAAFSLVGAALFSLVVLPHTFSLFKMEDFSASSRFERMVDNVVAFRFRNRKTLMAAVILITCILSWFAFDVSFENNLMNMNFMPERLKAAEDKLDAINNAHLRSVFCIAYGQNLNEAADANIKVNAHLDKLIQQGVVAGRSSISNFLISDSLQELRIARWNRYWTEKKKTETRNSIQTHAIQNGFSQAAFDPFFNLLNKDYKLINLPESGVFKNSMLSEFVSVKNNVVTILTGIKVDEKNRDKLFASLSGVPHVIVFDKLFVSTQLVQFLQSDFNTVLYISALLVFFFLLLSFGRIEPAVFSFLPMLISWLWILGIMALVGIKFNIVNIIISTFIFGLGDDYSIFNSEGMLREYSHGQKMLSSFKTSILLSALTSLIGVGTLIFAQHPALRSISLMTIIGMLCVVFISFYVQPMLYEFLIMNRKKNGKVPLTFISIFQSVFAFSYFFIGCLILTVIALIVYPLVPVRKKYKKHLFHNLLSLFCKSLVYIMFNVKKKIINEHRENFSKPAVVIANHQSFLDILLTVMISNKNILLVNDWVWNSPFFGRVVKLAGFYPVSKGFEESIPALTEAVELGYCIVVFPEGTRSRTPDIHRFHKGAFFIAEKFNLDIIPLLIHGTSDTMQKGDDFLLKSGQLTVKILPRIRSEDTSYGMGYYERTKNISKYFKAEYNKLREELETPVYFRDKLIKNYIYKGAVLEWYMRIKLRLENNYSLFLDRVPRTGSVVDLGCGYGNVSLMLGFISRQRQVTGVDYDEDKIAMASNAPTKPDNVHFICSDVLNYHFSPTDTFLLSDVLHYMPEEQQVSLLEKCIANLKEGGSVLIRDANADLSGRHRGTRLTEIFSTTFGFNKAMHGGMHFISGKTIERIAGIHQLHLEVIDNTKFTSNIFYHLRKKQRYGAI